MTGIKNSPQHDWNSTLDVRYISRQIRAARAQGRWDETAPAVIFHDLTRMKARITQLTNSFPENTLHAIAIKANPLVSVLSEAVRAGAGLEAASMEEVWLALAAGCPAERIIYDSPAKSLRDIEEALAGGIWINADNEQELARIDESLPAGYTGKIGLRINPLVGDGNIGTTSVGSRSSRFGLSIEESDQILALYGQYPWLQGLHVHVGSQGSPLNHLVNAVKRAFELREEINQKFGVERINFVDIGGGLPARYLMTDQPPTPSDYVKALRDSVPEFFDFPGRLITEFGRSVQASCGWVVSRVEYTKQLADKRIAVVHVGADLFMRSAYQPESWPLRFSVLDSQGYPKAGKNQKIQIVGPLCFAGDVLSEVVELPLMVEGDFLVIHDSGAYTLSMWSHHCNRAAPPVIGVRGEEEPHFELVRAKPTRAEVSALWSAPSEPD